MTKNLSQNIIVSVSSLKRLWLKVLASTKISSQLIVMTKSSYNSITISHKHPLVTTNILLASTFVVTNIGLVTIFFVTKITLVSIFSVTKRNFSHNLSYHKKFLQLYDNL